LGASAVSRILCRGLGLSLYPKIELSAVDIKPLRRKQTNRNKLLQNLFGEQKNKNKQHCGNNIKPLRRAKTPIQRSLTSAEKQKQQHKGVDKNLSGGNKCLGKGQEGG